MRTIHPFVFKKALTLAAFFFVAAAIALLMKAEPKPHIAQALAE